MNVLLVQPKYHTRFPPLGLLKISSLLKQQKHDTQLVIGEQKNVRKPDEIYVTSLYTYAWRPVHRAIRYYKRRFPKATIKLGGIYATILPDHAATSQADEILGSLILEAEELLPDYSLVPDWDGSIVFSSRGCIRKCEFCAVPMMEGDISYVRKSIKPFLVPEHKRIIFWDNNFFASPARDNILDELEELNKKVDFNQGTDARILTDNIAERITKLRIPLLRLAYDSKHDQKAVKSAIEKLIGNGFNSRNILVYTLFNFKDTPQDFFERVQDILSWKTVSYPMRYQPITGLKKNEFVSDNWTIEQLKALATARRVLGYGGAFPPYKRLVEKIHNAKSFDKAFELWPINWRELSVKPKDDILIDEIRQRTPRYVQGIKSIPYSPSIITEYDVATEKPLSKHKQTDF